MGIIVFAALMAAIISLLIINHIDKAPSRLKESNGCIGKLFVVCVIIMLFGLFAIGAKDCSNSQSYEEPTHTFRP